MYSIFNHPDVLSFSGFGLIMVTCLLEKMRERERERERERDREREREVLITISDGES